MSRLVVLFKTTFVIVCLLLSGCGGESYTYEAERELKPGPGLFSGKDGEFNIIGSSEKKEEGKKEQKIELTD